MRRLVHHHRVLALALGLAACRRDAPPPAPAPSATVVVRVDGVEAARVDATRLADQPRVGELARVALGAATIVGLDAVGRGGARQISETRRHPGQEPRLYLDDRGRPAFGWFRRTTDGAPGAPNQPMVDVAIIELHTAAPATPAAATLTVDLDGVVHTVSAAELATLPRRRTPGQGRRNQGWPMLDVIALVAPGTRPGRVEVLAGGAPVVLDADRLTDTADPPMLKQNRRGDLNLRSAQGPRVERVQGLRIVSDAK